MDKEPSSVQDAVNNKIKDDIEAIRRDVHNIYQHLYKDNGGEALQSKINRIEAEKKFMKNVMYSLLTLTGGIFIALVKIAFMP